MRDDLDAVPWKRLEHNYGKAKDVPGLLRASAAGDVEAISTLENNLFHQGGWVCSAATAALPFLVRLAADPSVEHRVDLLGIVTLIVRESVQVQDRFVDEGWPQALARETPALLGLLSDADPAIRRAAAYQAGALPVAEASAALLARWGVEADRVARWDSVLSLGELAARAPASGSAESALRITDFLTTLLTSDDEQLALAAVHALHEAGRITPGEHLEVLLRAVTGDVSGWIDSAHINCGRLGVTDWTADLLRGDPGAATAFTIGTSRGAGDAEQRIATAHAAGELLQEWRAPAAVLLPELARWLTDSEPEVRFRAAFLLGGLGPPAAEHADALALVAGDTAVRNGRSGRTVGEAGVWALARLGDERCVPALVDVLTRSSASGRFSAFYPIRPHFPEVPSLQETLVPLPQFSTAFLAQLRRILADLSRAPSTPDAAQWTSIMIAWGPSAAETVPELIALLRHEKTRAAATQALASIGPAAIEAAPALAKRMKSSLDAAWAYWKITSRPEPVLAALVKVPSLTASWGAIQKLGDLGPLAARYLDVLREASRSRDDWTRVMAARACWTVSGDVDPAIEVLLDVIRPLASGSSLPVQLPALRYLAALGPAAESAVPIAQSVLDNPRRCANHGGWHAFADDDILREAAAQLIQAARPT